PDSAEPGFIARLELRRSGDVRFGIAATQFAPGPNRRRRRRRVDGLDGDAARIGNRQAGFTRLGVRRAPGLIQKPVRSLDRVGQRSTTWWRYPSIVRVSTNEWRSS